MRKIQSPSSEESADGGSGKERSHHHQSVASSNGTSSKKSENGSNAVHQRNRSKIHLENLTSPSNGNGDKPKPLILELIIQKDKYGYGMKVSGENPVFVDSVKDGGAAHRAGLHAADMILRVNGHNVRYSTHAEVVQHMKATQNVELTVQRNARNFAMPTSGMSSNLGTPTTPTSQRNSITAPLPVDHLKRKEVEYTKLHTLYMMLEQEKKNLEKLREHESQNCGEIAKAEANIRTLQEQLRQSTNDSSTASLMAIITTASTKVTTTTTTISPVTAPTFLARFPRSLSQLNLGSKRKSSAASPQEPTAKPLPTVTSQNSSSSSSTPVSSPSHQQKVRVRHQHPTVTADVPPPLPQRNAPRKSLPTSPTNTPQISDLDASLMSAGFTAVPFGVGVVSGGGGAKKKNKQKIKAYSDPKMSSEIMLQMECASYQPPPLPPRPLFEDGAFGQVVTNKDNSDGSGGDGRALPNSISTQLNYPVITTSVAVRDGIIPPNFHHHHHHSFEGGMTTSSCSLPENPKAKKDGKNREGSGPEVSPPGTPPPPYHINNSPASSTAAQTNIEQQGILSFECDSETDDETLVEDDGVFRSISMVTAPENIAYLVVFLNFVLSNSKPAAILFYLITDLYKKGSVKEMRKWAYEIHSTFLVPTAPLSVFPVTDVQSETLARDVDDKLAQAKNYHMQDRGNQQDFEMGGLLRNVFQKSRARARDIINRQMEEFQEKRTAGLGTMYGPSGPELAGAKGNKQSEAKIVEDCLMPKLTTLLEECEVTSGFEETTASSKMALTSALSTVVHKVFLPRGGAVSGSERVHHYVTREKSFKSRLISKNRKALVRGHNLSLRQYYETTHCNHCQNLMWGVAPQGFTCAHCGLNVHRNCAKLLEETCPGPVNVPVDKFTKFMDRIREKGHGIQNAKKQEEEVSTTWNDAVTSDRSASFSARQKGDIQFQRPAHTSNSTSQLQSHPDTSQTDSHHPSGSNNAITNSIGGSSGVLAGSPQGNEGSGDHGASEGKRGKQKTSQPNARSESYKECSPKRSRTNRPKSDPSLYEDESSSQVDHHQDDVSNTSTSTTPGRPFTGTSLDSSSPATTDDESYEGWNAEMFQQLTETEKKRQEIINELFETEKNHVKILRTLHIKFMLPLEQNKVMTSELIQLVFPPAFLVLKDWHNSFIATLKQRWKEHNALVKDIGDCLNVFEGPSGDLLKEHAARFCARQQIALEVLKERRVKDEDLKAVLIKAEAHPDCNRHKLQDLLVTVLQRLTKYPLLFERLHKCSEGSDAEAIKKALDASKAILDYVNHAVRIAEDLRSIQRKLDKASYDKEAPKEFKNIDLTKYKLIHDGLLLIKKDDKKDDQKAIQLRVLLFDNMIVLLQKQDDKYLLKHFANPLAPTERTLVNPITKVGNLFARQNQSEKQSFFLIDLSQENSQQLLKLTAPNEEESKIWIDKITDTAERANKLKKVQQKPLPAVPPQPPPQALEETPENLLNAPPDDPTPSSVEEPAAPTAEKENEPIEETPQEDPNAVSTTQSCQLIQPSEISVAAQTVQEAALVVTPEESLRRHGQQIEDAVVEMERIICDINRVPPEHFAEIADIAAQPEAASDLAGLAMAAFAQSKFLVESLRTAMLNGLNSAPPSSFGGPALCDNCAVPSEFRCRSASEPLAPTSAAGGMEVDCEADTDGDNLYCEIEPIKDAIEATTEKKIVSHMEINENYSCMGENSSTGIIKVEKIAAPITMLNSLVSQLTIKIAERDQEREVYKRENQRLRQQLHLLQDDEVVSNAARELSSEKCDQDEQLEP